MSPSPEPEDAIVYVQAAIDTLDQLILRRKLESVKIVDVMNRLEAIQVELSALFAVDG